MGKEKEEDREGNGEGIYIRDVFDISLTEFRRLAIDRNCFRCVVKDATLVVKEVVYSKEN